MNAKQDAKLSMYRAIAALCDGSAPIVSKNVAFVAALGDFKTNIAAINTAAQQEAAVITGITIDKNRSKQTLCASTAEMAAMIYAYAATVGNNTLKMEADFPVSGLMKLRDDQLVPRCQNIHDTGETNREALADYGVTKANLADLQTAIDDYSAVIAKPRAAITNRKMQGETLDQLFEANDAILKDRMDKLAQTFRAANPDFVQTYEATRRVIKPPTTVTQLKGVITDKTTRAPIKNAHVTATPAASDSPDNADQTPFTTNTDPTGAYSFKPLPHAEYSLTVTAPGYTGYEAGNIDVKMGEINTVDVELVK